MSTNLPEPKQMQLDQWDIGLITKFLGSGSMSANPSVNMGNKTKKPTYRQDWPAYNQAQTQEKTLFMELLYGLTSQIHQPEYRGNGRPPANIGEMVFCCGLRQYHDFSSRRCESDIEIAKKLGYIEQAPHFNTILKYLNEPKMEKLLTKLIVKSSLPLKKIDRITAVDSSGFSTAMYGQWLKKRNVYNDFRRFKKAHVISGVKTNIITFIVVTDGYVADTKILETLIRNTAENFEMDEVVADKGYISERNLQIIFKNGAIPFIPFKRDMKNANKHRSIIWQTMFRFFQEHKEEYMKHYHQRSNAETVFAMMKRKFGDYVRTKNSLAQENEILCKALCHNICVLIQEMFELGIKVDFEETAQDFMCKIEW